MIANMQAALRAVYPVRCVSCGDRVEGDTGICARCWPEVPFIDGTVCDHCGTPLPGAATAEVELCDACMKTPRPWSKGRAAVVYEGRARKLVLGLKHGDRHDVIGPAANWMSRAGRDVLDGAVLVPIPLHWTRLFRRRFNQSALLARAVAKVTGCAHIPDALIRRRATPSLDRKSADERAMILDGAIVANPKYRTQISGAHVVLIDDVMTSGATYSAATEAILAADARRVDVLTLARVTKSP